MSHVIETPAAHPLPRYLEGLAPPVSIPEALAHAEERGAPQDFLNFLEALPAGVFTTEEGMRNAFASVDPDHLPDYDPNTVEIGEDGGTS